MKIERFYVENYRVLQNLTIDFSRGENSAPSTQQGYTLDFLVGVNGTGKTTVLQLLSKLFVWLSERNWFPVPFEIVYTLEPGEQESARQVQITNIVERTALLDSEATPADTRLFYRTDANPWQQGKIDANLLPTAVIVYTTGSEREWSQILALDNEPYSDGTTDADSERNPQTAEQPGHRPDLRSFDEETDEPDPEPHLLFIQATHMPLVTLCGLLASQRDGRIQSEETSASKEVLAPVLEALQLAPLQGFSLRVRAYANLTLPYQLEIIQNLRDVADQVIQEGGDQLLIFDVARQHEKKSSIFNLYNQPITLFRQLYRLYAHRPFYEPPLQEVNLFIHRLATKKISSTSDSGVPETKLLLQLFNWLSDGERSFLARMALFALFRANDLLILLDEPEVHFNDVWKREIVHTLDQIMRGHTSHALITTHSSIALTDVPSKDVIVLQRVDGRTSGADVVSERKFQTFGADPSDIMVHVFGTISANGEHSRRFIRQEIGRRNTRDELGELAEIVAPGYWRYRIQLEMARLEQLQ